MADWEKRLERDLENIVDDIVKYDAGILSLSGRWKIRTILKKLIEDVQSKTQEEDNKNRLFDL
jgi:hypothetical protein